MKRIPIAEVIAHAKSVGSHWFDPGAKAWFGSRWSDHAYLSTDGTRAYFWSSEQDTARPYAAWNGERRYTLRVADMTGSDRGCIDTVGEFGGIRTRALAEVAPSAACLEYDKLARDAAAK